MGLGSLTGGGLKDNLFIPEPQLMRMILTIKEYFNFWSGLSKVLHKKLTKNSHKITNTKPHKDKNEDSLSKKEKLGEAKIKE